MTRFVYSEVHRGSIDWTIVSHAERVLAEARHQLDLYGRHAAAYGIRWYIRSEHVAEYPLTRYGRVLDVPDDRHLSGWYLDPGWVAVRVDRPLREIGLTVAHEAYHAWQEAHDQPLDEDRAEAFARRLVTHLEGETR